MTHSAPEAATSILRGKRARKPSLQAREAMESLLLQAEVELQQRIAEGSTSDKVETEEESETEEELETEAGLSEGDETIVIDGSISFEATAEPLAAPALPLSATATDQRRLFACHPRSKTKSRSTLVSTGKGSPPKRRPELVLGEGNLTEVCHRSVPCSLYHPYPQ